LSIENPWGVTNPSVQDHIQPGRDFYDAVSASAQTSPTSPFNGTTGTGFGTLANRPTTCTHTTAPNGENGGGLANFATDQGTWKNGGAGGVLYRCSATNTWTVTYVPFTYPHPMNSGGSAAVPSAPSGLRIVP